MLSNGLPSAHVDLRALLRGDVVHEQIDDRIGGAGLRVGLDVVRALDLGLVELQVVVDDLLLVEAVVGDLAAVGRPPHGARLRQLLAVHPARGAVLDAVLVVAVGRDRRLVRAGGVAHPEVAIAIERLQLAVGRVGRRGLPAALDARATPSAAASTPAGSAIRVGHGTQLSGAAGRDVEAIPLPVEDVLDAAAVRAPGSVDRPRTDGPVELRADLLELRVARHRLQAVLRARRYLKESRDGGKGQQADGQGGCGAGEGPWQLTVHGNLLDWARWRRLADAAPLFSLYNIPVVCDKSGTRSFGSKSTSVTRAWEKRQRARIRHEGPKHAKTHEGCHARVDQQTGRVAGRNGRRVATGRGAQDAKHGGIQDVLCVLRPSSRCRPRFARRDRSFVRLRVLRVFVSNSVASVPSTRSYGRNGWATSTISHQRPAASRFQSRR